MASRFATWGSTAAERTKPYPCDGLVTKVDAALFRAVSVNAPPSVVFRWLCQLRVAAYSYDWIDQGGRKSPVVLTPHLDALEVGLPVMKIFRIAAFAKDEHLTLLLSSPPKGGQIAKLVVSYVVVPSSDGSSRLVAKTAVEATKTGLAWHLGLRMLAFGDFIMMRKQLLTLKALSERQGGSA